MRILELELSNFGALEHRRLELPHDGPVLHLLYGENEAGKSTTLRAILALFYGLESRSADARLFGPDGLRIRARLRDRMGEELVVTRVKGRKTTLRGESDEPLDESRLLALLGGLPQPVFRTMFGLDHHRLREGGEQLRNGRGELGESLFQAGLGGAGIHRLLQQLKLEADALFRPSGRLPPLNDAIRSYRDACKRAREATTRAESFRLQQEELDRGRSRAEGLQARRRGLLAEQSRLRRILRALPGLARRRELLTRRYALGTVLLLPEDSAELRRCAQGELSGAARERKQLATTIAKLEARRAELEIPQTLAELNPDVMRALRNRLGNHLKALEELPRRRGEWRRLRETAAAALRELGKPVPLERVETLRVDRPTQAHVAQLAGEFSGLAERLSAAVRHSDMVAAEESQLAAELEQEAPMPNCEALEHALAVARSGGDVAGRAEALRAELEHERGRAEQRLRALGLSGVSLAELAGLPWPSEAEVSEARTGFEACERTRAELETAGAELEARDLRALQSLRTLERAGVPPSEAELETARAERTEVWRMLREGLEREDAALARAQLDRYERARQHTDALADRLRREADRVTRRAALLSEAEALTLAREGLQRRQEALREHEQRAELRWREVWRGIPLAPGSVAQMQALLGKIGNLLELGERSAERSKTCAALEAQAQALRDLLHGGLVAAGEPGVRRDEALSSALLRAEKAWQRAERRGARRAEVERKLRALAHERTRAEVQRQQAEHALERWREQWASRMRQLKLAPDASVAEALSVIEGRSRLLAAADEMQQLLGLIEAMEQDQKQFRRDVHALMDRHLFALRELVVEEAADELLRRYDQARADLLQRERLDQDLAEAKTELAELERIAAEAGEQLATLQRAAGAADEAELEQSERRSEEARALARDLADVEDELLRHGEGATLDELSAQAAEHDLDRLRPRLLEIETELEELDEAYRELLHQVGRLEQGLHSLEQDERAADAAAEAEQQLSRIRAHAHSYVRRRLAIELLQREIRRYRDENQGPVVERASTLFERLTVGQHRGLRVGYDNEDQPVLLCIDAQGRSVQVELLSDGARDQLYLALRLASLERFVAQREPLPLLLDDALIHFDDERARAALAVLGEFAASTQVLFFTHHARLLELARQAVPAGRLVEHRLVAARCRPAANMPRA